MNNDNRNATFYGYANGQETMSQSVILNLEQGDEVTLVLRSGALNYSGYTIFSGFLLHEELPF